MECAQHRLNVGSAVGGGGAAVAAKVDHVWRECAEQRVEGEEAGSG